MQVSYQVRPWLGPRLMRVVGQLLSQSVHRGIQSGRSYFLPAHPTPENMGEVRNWAHGGDFCKDYPFTSSFSLVNIKGMIFLAGQSLCPECQAFVKPPVRE